MTEKTNNKTGDNIPMEALRLVPWYATGSLSGNELAYIEEQLKKHPALKKYIDEEKEMIHLVEEDKSILDLSALEPTTVRLEKVLVQMEGLSQDGSKNSSSEESIANELPTIQSKQTKSFGERIKERANTLFFGNSQRFRYASFASIAVFLALLVAFIAPLVNNETSTVFYPAAEKSTESGKQATSTQLLVGIKGDTQNAWLAGFLEKNNASLSKVPSKDGLFHINLDKKLSSSEIKSLLDQLHSQKEFIWFAGEAY